MQSADVSLIWLVCCNHCNVFGHDQGNRLNCSRLILIFLGKKNPAADEKVNRAVVGWYRSVCLWINVQGKGTYL